MSIISIHRLDSMLDDTNTATRVLVCGLLSADVVFNVDAIPADAIKYRANKVSLKCGGGGCYAAIAINRLGGNACLLAQLGDEEFGQFMLAALTAYNIDCSHVSVEKDSQSPVSSIAIDKNGDRQILNYRNTAAAPVTRDLSFSRAPQAVLVDTRWLEGSIAALEYANAQNIPGVIDAEAPTSVAAMSIASHIAFSRQGLSDFASTDSILLGLQKAQASFSAWVCVTDGENGTHMLQGSEVVTVAAPTITAVDSLGAGDVWHGAFTVQLAQGFDEISAVKFANVTAALKCASTGDEFSAPQLQTVAQFINDCYE